MADNRKLGQRELQVVQFVAWGASQKEIADELGISYRTVDNTVRHAKEKLGLQKNTELAAWWFCTTFGISFQLSPLRRKILAVCLALLFFLGELATHKSFCRVIIRRIRIECRMYNRKEFE